MLIKKIVKHIYIKEIKEDARKLGINLVTAGVAGLFVTHIAGLTPMVVLSSIWLAIVGLAISFFGLHRRKNYDK